KAPSAAAAPGPDSSASTTPKPNLGHAAALLPPVPSDMASESVGGTNLAKPNDIIRARGYWQGPPDGMAVAPSPRSPVRDAAAAKPNNARAATAAIGGPVHHLRDDPPPGATPPPAEQPPARPPPVPSPAAP